MLDKYQRRATTKRLKNQIRHSRDVLYHQAEIISQRSDDKSIDSAILMIFHHSIVTTVAIYRLATNSYYFPAEVLQRFLMEAIATQYYLKKNGQPALIAWLRGKPVKTKKQIKQLIGEEKAREHQEAVDGVLKYFNILMHADSEGAMLHARNTQGGRQLFDSGKSHNQISRYDDICNFSAEALSILHSRTNWKTVEAAKGKSKSLRFPKDPFIQNSKVQTLDSFLMIASAINANYCILSKDMQGTAFELAAVRLLPHSYSLILGIRDLMRAAQFVPAQMLIRTTLERISLLCYFLEQGEKAAWDWLYDGKRPTVSETISSLPFNSTDIFAGLLDTLHDITHVRPHNIFMASRTLDPKTGELDPTLAQLTALDYCNSAADLLTVLVVIWSYAAGRAFPGISSHDFTADLVLSCLQALQTSILNDAKF